MSILTVTSGPMAGQLAKIDQRVVVGRHADVSIDDDELSLHHFAVQAIADGILVEDLGSTNGTFVGEDRITGAVTVPGGTLIRAGQSEFTVDLHAGEATALRPILANDRERPVAPIVRVRSGPAAGTSLQVTGPISIGRVDADLTIAESLVSRRHAVLRPAPGGGVVIEDLGSANGTFIDGSRLTGSQTVTTSATVTIGDTDIEIEMPASDLTPARRPDIAAPDDRTRLGAQVPAPAPPAAVSPSPAASPPPPETPTGRGPRDAGLPKRPATTSSPVARIALTIVLVVAVVLTLAILGSSSTPKQTRPVSFYLRTTTREETNTASTIDGLQTGSPTGTGAALVTQTVTAPTTGALFATGAATPFTWQLATFFETGSVRATISGTTTRGTAGSLIYVGKGEIVSGTGTFKQASGTLALSGTVPPLGSAAAALATQQGANGQGGGVNSVTTPTVPPPAVPLTDGGVFTITGSIRY